MIPGDDHSARFAARHPWVSPSACYCNARLGRKCSVCALAVVAERASLVERDAIGAFLIGMGRKRQRVGTEAARLEGNLLLDVAALVEEGVHLAGSTES